jgi:hypothetical protein
LWLAGWHGGVAVAWRQAVATNAGRGEREAVVSAAPRSSGFGLRRRRTLRHGLGLGRDRFLVGEGKFRPGRLGAGFGPCLIGRFQNRCGFGRGFRFDSIARHAHALFGQFLGRRSLAAEFFGQRFGTRSGRIFARRGARRHGCRLGDGLRNLERGRRSGSFEFIRNLRHVLAANA